MTLKCLGSCLLSDSDIDSLGSDTDHCIHFLKVFKVAVVGAGPDGAFSASACHFRMPLKHCPGENLEMALLLFWLFPKKSTLQRLQQSPGVTDKTEIHTSEHQTLTLLSSILY